MSTSQSIEFTIASDQRTGNVSGLQRGTDVSSVKRHVQLSCYVRNKTHHLQVTTATSPNTLRPVLQLVKI